jgi:primosomal protein N''
MRHFSRILTENDIATVIFLFIYLSASKFQIWDTENVNTNQHHLNVRFKKKLFVTNISSVQVHLKNSKSNSNRSKRRNIKQFDQSVCAHLMNLVIQRIEILRKMETSTR